MRLPHWFGFRVIRQQEYVRLAGRNAAVPLFLALFVLIISIVPLVVVLLGADRRLTSEPVASLALFVLLIGGLAIYSATSIPTHRDLIFSPERLGLNDTYILGKQARDISYSSLMEIRFSVSRPYKSLFEITHITLSQKDGSRINLVHHACPMYSWQGREAYRAIKEFLDRRGQSYLLGPEPKFSYLEHEREA